MKQGRPSSREPKAKLVQLRLSVLEKQGFTEAAELAGIGVSTWMRERLRQAAIRELEGAGKRVPFVAPFEIGSNING
jgi:hypothetical protein